MKNKILIITTLLLIGVAFWVLNFLTPEFFDDYFYKYIFDNSFNTNTPIKSIKDILISQYNHYFYFNGRTVVHIIVQLFTGILGKDLFNIANAIIFLFFIYMLTRLYAKATSFNIFFSCSIILLLYPIFKETALWMTGSINYLWTSAFICFFLYVIEKYNEETMHSKYIIWSIPCLLIGWTHEGIALPLSMSIIVYIFINHKTIYKQASFPLMVGFIIGAFLCAFSPATLNKASHQNDFDILGFTKKIVGGIIFCVENLKAFNSLLCATIILLFIKEKPFLWIKEFYKQNIIVCNALFVSFGLIFVVGCQYLRAATGTELFSIIILLRILQYYNTCILQKIKIVVCMISCILYSVIIYYSVGNYQEYKFINSQIKNKKSNIILTKETLPRHCIESYILPYVEDYKKDSPFARFSYNCIENIYIAATYNYEKIAFVPMDIYNDIINQKATIKDIQKQKEYSIYVIPMDKKTDVSPRFILSPTNYQQLPFYIRLLAHKMQRYTAKEMPISRYDIINIKGKDYLFIGKNMMIEDRVQAISLK